MTKKNPTINQMAINSVITLNVSGLNAPVKRPRVAG